MFYAQTNIERRGWILRHRRLTAVSEGSGAEPTVPSSSCASPRVTCMARGAIFAPTCRIGLSKSIGKI
jgi:hypothetical protein